MEDGFIPVDGQWFSAVANVVFKKRFQSQRAADAVGGIEVKAVLFAGPLEILFSTLQHIQLKTTF